jgi:LacI family transcriptional regulator
MKNRSSAALRLPPGLPHVFVNLLGPDSAVSVLPDEFEGGRTAVRALIDNGHRDRIALVGASFEGPGHEGISPTAQRRLSGIASEMTVNELSFVREATFAEWEPENGYLAARQMLRDDRPTSFICMNDRLAVGVYQAIAEAGLAVPRDVSVVSFDDDEIAASLRPRLTTVAIPHELMGAIATDSMSMSADTPTEVLVSMPLRAGGSLARPRAG